MKKLLLSVFALLIFSLAFRSGVVHAAAFALPVEPGSAMNKPASGGSSESGTGSGRSDSADSFKSASIPASISKTLSELESSTTIPTVCVYTKDSAEVVSREEYVECEVYTINCDDEYRLSAVPAGIKVRGNSTAYEGNVNLIRKNQVPYRIKFEKKQRMFGLNSDAKCKSWVLLKGGYDLLKNDVGFRFGRTFLRNGNYCSDGIPVHVYLNGKFVGTYELCEQNQVNGNRVDIFEAPEGYTGTDIGYFVELDNHGELPRFRVSYCGNPSVTDLNGVTKSFKTVFYSIKSDTWSEAQENFINKYINNCFKIVYNACEKGKYYVFNKDYGLTKAKSKQLKKTDADGNAMSPAEIVIDRAVDLDSFVDIFLVYELTMSRDVGEGSFFMCADFSDSSNIKKLTFTAPWDFEWSMLSATTGSYAKVFNDESFSDRFGERSNPWYIILMKQDWFLKRVKDRWTELRTAKGKKKSAVDQVISDERALLAKYKTDLSKPIPYEDNGTVASAEALMKWLEKRIAWMDKEYLN
ncbi:MAG: CotH kinase family protein [Lachnospiraceae bacterium]|nr:CotH kinase family protein [Lachnospiraceae bacterium]